MYGPSIFGHGFPKTKARILGVGDVGVWNTELVTELVTGLVMEFTSDQMEMINKTIAKAITGANMEMTAELTGDWIRD